MIEQVEQRLGNYRLKQLLGKGAFADVYLGEHLYLSTPVAVKVLHSRLDSSTLADFLTEARHVSHLVHPHIIRVFDFGLESDVPFLVMDYAPNGNLRQKHPPGSAVPLPTIVTYVMALASALQYAHDQHLVLIFDEAQEMSDRTLSELKLLTNYNGAGKAFLTILLLGQPELRQRVAQIQVGDPAENKYMGPVINEGAMKSILNYIEIGKKEGRLVTGGKRASGDGYFIEPTVIEDVDPKSRLSQEEIFGPVLAVMKVKDFDEALATANDTDYGLTGAIYSTSEEKIERAKREFHVGNLYINRKCTGAVVGAHPFGGFNMSGTDSKAGGTDYLYLFSQAKSIGHKLN